MRRAIVDLDEEALERFRRLTDFYVILRPGERPAVARWIASYPGGEHLFDLGDAVVYRLPRLAGASTHPLPLPLPRPGEPPFELPAQN
jgi:hypothetical protein